VLRVPLAPIHSVLDAGARAAIVRDALAALQEHISQDLDWHIVLNVSGGLFQIRDPRPARIATLGLSRPTELLYALIVPQANSPLRMDAPHQEVAVRAVMQESSRLAVAWAAQTRVHCAQQVPTHWKHPKCA
jgi:hypothetical protein